MCDFERLLTTRVNIPNMFLDSFRMPMPRVLVRRGGKLRVCGGIYCQCFIVLLIQSCVAVCIERIVRRARLLDQIFLGRAFIVVVEAGSFEVSAQSGNTWLTLPCTSGSFNMKCTACISVVGSLVAPFAFLQIELPLIRHFSQKDGDDSDGEPIERARLRRSEDSFAIDSVEEGSPLVGGIDHEANPRRKGADGHGEPDAGSNKGVRRGCTWGRESVLGR